jgi:predicted TIM-barrel fold metal-dependent hydrolase
VSGANVLPPDARLRAPKRPLPRGTVDCHAHIFDRFDKYKFSSSRKYSPPLCSREAWLDLHAALGVERGVVDQLEGWLPSESLREPLFASNAARLYRF